MQCWHLQVPHNFPKKIYYRLFLDWQVLVKVLRKKKFW